MEDNSMRLKKLVVVALATMMTLTMAVSANAKVKSPTGGGSSNATGGGGGGGGVAVGTTHASGSVGTVLYGWHYVPEVDKWWYEYNDHTWAVGWAKLYWKPWGADQGYEAWYHFDNDGWMDTGWFHDADNNDYYLHPVADGTRGYMYTGNHNLGGANYSFEETAGQLQGHLLR